MCVSFTRTSLKTQQGTGPKDQLCLCASFCCHITCLSILFSRWNYRIFPNLRSEYLFSKDSLVSSIFINIPVRVLLRAELKDEPGEQNKGKRCFSWQRACCASVRSSVQSSEPTSKLSVVVTCICKASSGDAETRGSLGISGWPPYLACQAPGCWEMLSQNKVDRSWRKISKVDLWLLAAYSNTYVCTLVWTCIHMSTHKNSKMRYFPIPQWGAWMIRQHR